MRIKNINRRASEVLSLAIQVEVDTAQKHIPAANPKYKTQYIEGMQIVLDYITDSEIDQDISSELNGLMLAHIRSTGAYSSYVDMAKTLNNVKGMSDAISIYSMQKIKSMSEHNDEKMREFIEKFG